MNGITYQVFAEHCLQHSRGASFPKQLEHFKFDKIIKKGTDKDDECFSAFASFGKHRDTGLADYLKQNGIKDLYIAGVTLEQCVLHSVKHAIQAGFEVFLLVDACAPVDADAEKQTIQELQHFGAKSVLSKSVLSGL